MPAHHAREGPVLENAERFFRFAAARPHDLGAHMHAHKIRPDRQSLELLHRQVGRYIVRYISMFAVECTGSKFNVRSRMHVWIQDRHTHCVPVQRTSH